MGDILQRGSKWAIRYFDADGRRRVKTTTATSRSEARRLLVQAEADAARGVVPGSTITVAELCQRFLASPHPRAKDPERYRRTAGYGLAPALPIVGAIPLAKLRPRDLEALRDRLMLRYQPNSVASILRPLAAALTWAVRHELITASPMTGLRLPRKTALCDRLDEAAAKRLLDAARGQCQARYVAVSLALRLGLRFGEVWGLCWRDIDLPRRRLTIARSFASTPKSGRPRTVPIPDGLHEVLTAWQPHCPPTAEGLVCPLGFRRAAGWLATLYQRIGVAVPPRPWHALRHTFASLFIEAGGSIVALKEILGHRGLDMTLLYSHVAPAALHHDLAKLKL